MSSVEPARHALYAELKRVLGSEHAETLMTHLPHNPSDSVATKDDIGLIDERFDRLEARFDRMEDRMDSMQRNFIAVSFGTLTVMTAIFSLITRI